MSDKKEFASQQKFTGPNNPRKNVVTLDLLPHGVMARVVAVNGDGPVARRLVEMGIVPGVPVCSIKTAPLGDPIKIRVRNYHLAIRRTEAQTVSVVTSDE